MNTQPHTPARRRGRHAPIMQTELGQERRCSKCGEFWPDDTEFFFRSKGKTCSPCKACYYQMPSAQAKNERDKAKRAAVRAQKHATQGN